MKRGGLTGKVAKKDDCKARLVLENLNARIETSFLSLSRKTKKREISLEGDRNKSRNIIFVNILFTGEILPRVKMENFIQIAMLCVNRANF